MLLFIIEIIIASYCKIGYFGSFFFWLDVLSTISMVFDIGWFMDLVNLIFTGGSSKTNNATSVAKTS